MLRVASLSLLALLAVVLAAAKDDLKVEKVFVPDECGVKTKNGDTLTMHYKGTLQDGTQFDSRYVPTGVSKNSLNFG